jgi:hypothetical protein
MVTVLRPSAKIIYFRVLCDEYPVYLDIYFLLNFLSVLGGYVLFWVIIGKK